MHTSSTKLQNRLFHVHKEFYKLRRLLQRKHNSKTELNDYFTLVTLIEMGKVSFDLIGTNCFHIKAEKEMFSTVGLRCRQNLKFKNWPTLGAYHLLKAGRSARLLTRSLRGIHARVDLSYKTFYFTSQSKFPTQKGWRPGE